MTPGEPRDERASVHVSIDVPDLEAGLRFYGSVFGFVETARPFPTMAILDANNLTVCMHAKAAGTTPSPEGAVDDHPDPRESGEDRGLSSDSFTGAGAR